MEAWREQELIEAEEEHDAGRRPPTNELASLGRSIAQALAELRPIIRQPEREQDRLAVRHHLSQSKGKGGDSIVNEPKPDAASTLFHDLNNGLGTIIGRCDLFLGLMANHPDLQHVLIIRETATRMADQIRSSPLPVPLSRSSAFGPLDSETSKH